MDRCVKETFSSRKLARTREPRSDIDNILEIFPASVGQPTDRAFTSG
jgi:hypothetical protein